MILPHQETCGCVCGHSWLSQQEGGVHLASSGGVAKYTGQPRGKEFPAQNASGVKVQCPSCNQFWNEVL